VRLRFKPLGDCAEYVKYKPTTLNMNLPPSKTAANKQIPGLYASQEISFWLCKQPEEVQRTCASRNDTRQQDVDTFRGKAQPQPC